MKKYSYIFVLLVLLSACSRAYLVYDVEANQIPIHADYPNQDDNGYNPYGNSDLANFGYDVSIIAEAHYVPADRVGISEERLISSIKHVK